MFSCTASKNEYTKTSSEVMNVEKEKDKVLEKIESMNLREKIGQLFIVGFDGNDNLSDNDVELIKNHKVSGFIFFRRNIATANQTINLINKIKEINNNNIPMFLSLDQEGGIVTRLPEEIRKFPRAVNIGEKNDEEFTYKVSKLMGDIIRKLGFNMNFAPVLDINTNPKNTVIGSRAFSNDKDIVANMAISVLEAFKDSGIIAVGKHFPGHGDTYEDSHYELPIVKHDYSRVFDVELYPFIKSIQNGIDAILSSHILYESIDRDNVVTLSREFLYNILREQLDFRGVVISDDMIMKGITSKQTVEEASIKALKAGVDLLLIGSSYDIIVSTINRIEKAVIDGDIDETDIDRKVYRILKLKEKYDINNNRIENVDIFEINKQIDSLIK